MPDQRADRYGSVSLSPTDEVVAGTYVTWTIRYVVGDLGMDDGGMFKLAIHQTSDLGTPQFDDPTADNYATVSVSGDADVTASYETEGHVRPYRHAIVVKVVDGSLKPGETIKLTLGDTSEGSLGHRAQTFAERDVKFKTFVDPHKTGDFVRLSADLSFDVVPGQAESVTAVLPGTVNPGERASLSVRAEDYWGNVATGYDGTLFVEVPVGLDAPGKVGLVDGVGHVPVTFADEGVHRATVRDPETGAEVSSNRLC